MLSILKNFIARFALKRQKSEMQSLKQNQDAGNTKTGKKTLKTRVKKLNKNNIPILDNNTEVEEYFKDDDNLPKACVKKEKKEKKRTPVLKKDTDFSEDFKDDQCNEVKIPSNKVLKTKARKQKIKNTFPVNKNGVLVLNHNEDLSKYFMDNNHDNTDLLPLENHSDKKKPVKKAKEDNFEEMLEKSLAGKHKKNLLQEKHEKIIKDKPLTKKEIIKFYPFHQEELDLHGCTAEQALEENENFIRRAWHKGKRTLLIIVGKGIHTHGKAVLPDVIENQILEFIKKNIVLAYEWDKGIKRKSGALIVYLKE